MPVSARWKEISHQYERCLYIVSKVHVKENLGLCVRRFGRAHMTTLGESHLQSDSLKDNPGSGRKNCGDYEEDADGKNGMWLEGHLDQIFSEDEGCFCSRARQLGPSRCDMHSR